MMKAYNASISIVIDGIDKIEKFANENVFG